MQWITAALLACGCVNLAQFADFPPAKDYIATTACSQSGDQDRCAKTRATWVATYARAVGGAYDSQQTVSLCFSTGCDTAIVEDRVLGCAWRQVISGSNHRQSADADKASVETYCGAGMLDNADRQTARDQAGVWLQLLGVTQ
ncbi:hypothetical protein [Rhizobium sp. 18055]|uniref:hypothetical protein n=1 Tax=Rhizobium sp. 18055 TaxID=2681403 RepID=UPI001FCEDCAC|nr:hypothetical protein [Rhizobium sp. 18055]